MRTFVRSIRRFAIKHGGNSLLDTINSRHAITQLNGKLVRAIKFAIAHTAAPRVAVRLLHMSAGVGYHMRRFLQIMALTSGYYPPSSWTAHAGAKIRDMNRDVLQTLAARGWAEPAKAWVTVYLAGEPIGECEVETYRLTEAGWDKAGGRPAELAEATIRVTGR
jgi:hypothetical protein